MLSQTPYFQAMPAGTKPHHIGSMIDRLPRRLRLGFKRADTTPADTVTVADEVDFVAYGEDCLLSGRAVLQADRLSDMLNANDEYDLVGVSVERLEGGESLAVDEIVVPRDEIFMVHATGPRGDAARRHRTTPQHLAMRMGPYRVRGFFHALPGADPVVAIRRRKAMVPLTDARIEYTFQGTRREVRVDTVIVNRDQIDWVEAVQPGLVEFPDGPKRLVAKPA
jgi:hypothetical protein